ncbi:MAG: LLM class flavin-dependent oxidoreductase [Roseomonas sp.]|nr:LLM class flavin-dependent oxidoreductase [Roseomonas sp.]MCA3315495.1 LLM class flavin-dependent oxidoreductase [Roseomonas sp.]MCA3321117.1 LLM class flavin-dependent oxidoreductase [Roseomonas sp.]
MKQMTLVAFLQAQNCSNYVGSWRHPATMQDYLRPEYYQRIARTLEAGCFHMAFFDDRLAMPDILGHDHAEAVRNGIRVVKLDLVSILTAMGLATSKLGLGGTYSTTYYEPFHVARVFATLDHMLGGRAAWNVVTSLNDSEAHNMGADDHLEHDLRYDRADEFLEIVLSHWDSWGDDAIIQDRESGVFADPSKVRRLDHKGKWFKSRGPFTVPRTPQGRPVLIQAGQSGRGKTFAARWGDLVFVIYANMEVAKRGYRDFKEQVAASGRDPATVRICPAVYCIVGETEAAAEEKRALIDGLAKPVDGLSLLSEALNYDFASKALDDAFTDDELAGIKGLQALRDRVVASSGKRNPTLRDFVEITGRGTIREFPVFCGTPKRVADEMQAWVEGGACDGFVLAATHMPGTYEEFVRLVVPELQRRGVFRKEFTGTTLRENLGLPRAAPFDWQR